MAEEKKGLAAAAVAEKDDATLPSSAATIPHDDVGRAPQLYRFVALTAFIWITACGDDGGIPRDACGRIHQQCDWNEETQKFDRNCKFVAPPDGAVSACDAGRRSAD